MDEVREEGGEKTKIPARPTTDRLFSSKHPQQRTSQLPLDVTESYTTTFNLCAAQFERTDAQAGKEFPYPKDFLALGVK